MLNFIRQHLVHASSRLNPTIPSLHPSVSQGELSLHAQCYQALSLHHPSPGTGRRLDIAVPEYIALINLGPDPIFVIFKVEYATQVCLGHSFAVAFRVELPHTLIPRSPAVLASCRRVTAAVAATRHTSPTVEARVGWTNAVLATSTPPATSDRLPSTGH